jgi:hypothetical protein
MPALAQVSFTLASSYQMTTSGANWVTKADLNSDGIPDLVCASGALHLFTNNGNAGFTFTRYLSSAYSVTAADFSGDGVTDLAATTGTSFDVYTNVSNSGAISRTSYGVGEGGGGYSLSILTNDGVGRFATASSPFVGSAPWAVVPADFNDDGTTDLAVANTGLTILTNDGHGNFVIPIPPGAYFVGGSARSVSTADVNGDGLMDVVTAGPNTNSVWIMTNAGNAKFALRSVIPVGRYPSSVASADLDGNQGIDLVVANYYDQTFSIVTNDGSGDFAIAVTVAVPGPPSCVIAADLNEDGKADLATANYWPATMSVFLNTPTLGITKTNLDIRLSWPAWSGWDLQVTDAINSTGWLPSLFASTSDGTNRSVTIAPTNAAQFFRLAK